MRKVMWPILRADFHMVESYELAPDASRVRCPLTAIGACDDTRYKPEQVAAWEQHAGCGEAGAKPAFHQVWLQGVGHNFFHEPGQQLLDELRAVLQR